MKPSKDPDEFFNSIRKQVKEQIEADERSDKHILVVLAAILVMFVAFSFLVLFP